MSAILGEKRIKLPHYLLIQSNKLIFSLYFFFLDPPRLLEATSCKRGRYKQLMGYMNSI